MTKIGAESDKVRLAICEALDRGRHWLLTELSRTNSSKSLPVENLGRTAVTKTLMSLETSGVFNAGAAGAEPTASGRIELSAAVSCRHGFHAVAAVPGVASAVQILEAFPWTDGNCSSRSSTTIAGINAVPPQQQPLSASSQKPNSPPNRFEGPTHTETVGCVLYLEVNGVGHYFAGAATGGTRGRPDGCLGGVPIDGAVIHTTKHAAAAISGVPHELVSASAARRMCSGASLLQLTPESSPCGYVLLKARTHALNNAIANRDTSDSVPCSQANLSRVSGDEDPALVSMLSQSPSQLSQSPTEAERQLNVSLKASVQNTFLTVGFVKHPKSSVNTADATVVIVRPNSLL
jgi:hypothetical protein